MQPANVSSQLELKIQNLINLVFPPPNIACEPGWAGQGNGLIPHSVVIINHPPPPFDPPILAPRSSLAILGKKCSRRLASGERVTCSARPWLHQKLICLLCAHWSAGCAGSSHWLISRLSRQLELTEQSCGSLRSENVVDANFNIRIMESILYFV